MESPIRCWFGIIGTLVVMIGLTSCTEGSIAADDASTPVPTLAARVMGELTFSGSTTMEPLVTRLGEAFTALYPQVSLDIQADGSDLGMKDAQSGVVDIGMSSRPLTAEEQAADLNLMVHPIALDAIAIIVHPTNPIDNLSMAQLRAIFTGEITNWEEVGGPDGPILPIVRQEGSGTRATFDALVMAGALYTADTVMEFGTISEAEQVATTEHAIGYASLGYANQNAVKVLRIDSITPDTQSPGNDYPLQRPLLLITSPLSRALSKTFIDFALSDTGQQIIAEAGWTPIRAVTEAR